MYAYVGCYTTPDREGHGTGITTYQVDPATGAWATAQHMDGVTNPSFLAVDPRQHFLYCVHGGREQGVSSFAIDPTTRQLAYLNTQPSGGANPVHLSIYADGRGLVVANYTAGTVAWLPIAHDGALRPPAHILPLDGQPGPDPIEQAGPHPHHIPLDPSGRFAVVPDKGLDRVFTFRLDPEAGAFVPTIQKSVQARAGAGPRHAAFHPQAPYVYVINELDSTTTVYHFDSHTGALDSLQVVATLPREFGGRSTGAEIAVAPTGRFVYASNRGHDSIVVFGVDPASGLLTTLGWHATEGRQPRHFALDPAGRWLYAANQASDSITTFAVDPTDGRLMATGQTIHTGSPVSIVFVGT